MTGARRAGVVFVVLFVAAFVVSFGTLMGSFADPDRVFTERFAEDGDRIRDIAGSYLMVFAGLAFVWFAHSMAHAAPSRRAALLVTGSATGGAMVVAAVAAATVPMSRWFGDLVDDPGLQEGQAVLPQLAYVALGMGAMVPAAAFIVVASRAPGLLPRWLGAVGYPAAVLVAFSALLFMPLFVFVAWVVAAAVRHQPAGLA
ncbi:MAG: hypothetical protein ACRDYW_06605 [Acidimicrobiales bacterium]